MEKQDIYKKIEEKGKEEAKKIILAGKKEAQTIKMQILDKVEAEILAKKEDFLKSISEQLVAKESVLKQKEKMSILKDKKNIMISILDSTFQEMQKMTDEKLKKYVITIIKSETISGNETIKVSKDEYDKYLKLFSSEKSKEEIGRASCRERV